MSEQTSQAIAALAAKGVRDPGSLTLAEVRRVCASALTQAAPKAPLWRRLLMLKPDG